MNPTEDRSGGGARAADNQNERNVSKSQEIIIPAAQGLRPGISASFISLRLIVVRRIGGTHDKCDYLGSAHSAEQSCRLPKREINHAEIYSGRKGRATKNLGDFWWRRPHQKFRRF